MRRAAIDATGWLDVSSLSRRRPVGVSSNTHENTSAGAKPSASRMISARSTQPGTSNAGNNVSATCTINHAPTRYSPAIRITLRRLSSANRSFIGHRSKGDQPGAAGKTSEKRASPVRTPRADHSSIWHQGRGCRDRTSRLRVALQLAALSASGTNLCGCFPRCRLHRGR